MDKKMVKTMLGDMGSIDYKAGAYFQWGIFILVLILLLTIKEISWIFGGDVGIFITIIFGLLGGLMSIFFTYAKEERTQHAITLATLHWNQLKCKRLLDQEEVDEQSMEDMLAFTSLEILYKGFTKADVLKDLDEENFYDTMIYEKCIQK